MRIPVSYLKHQCHWVFKCLFSSSTVQSWGGWGEIVEVGFLGKQVTSPSSLGLGWVGLMRSLQGRCAGFGLEGRQT